MGHFRYEHLNFKDQNFLQYNIVIGIPNLLESGIWEDSVIEEAQGSYLKKRVSKIRRSARTCPLK